MNGRTHLMLGLAAGAVVASTTPSYTALVFPGSMIVTQVLIVLIAGGAALLPDIDHPKSIISGYTPGAGHMVRLFTSHRTWTHSLLFAAALVGIVWYASGQGAVMQTVLAAAAGIASHLVGDMLTPAGIPLLLPVSGRSFRLAPAALLGVIAWLLEAAAAVGAAACIIFLLGRGAGL